MNRLEVLYKKRDANSRIIKIEKEIVVELELIFHSWRNLKREC